jgi:predicted enzyme related to lactoylglutathione lyase
MLTTQYVPGTPCWLDLGSSDIEATAAYYTGLFGWTFESLGPEAQGYGLCRLDGKTVAAIGSLEEGARPAWMVYFQTHDANATTKTVEQVGGTVRAQPFDIGDQGRMAQLTDPAGGEFAVLEPGGLTGLELVTDPGSLGWVELHTSDPAGVRGFYQSVFDWHVEDMPMGDMSYAVVSPSGGDDSSSMAGIVQLQPGDRAHWLPYFEVADCDGVVAMAQQLGGTVVAPAADMTGVGRMAFLSDPHGARFAVITSAAT